VQGPPGSGKTHAAAHVIVALVRAGRRVGVTANSHEVIQNVLRKVIEASSSPLRVLHIDDADDYKERVVPFEVTNDYGKLVPRLRSGEIDVIGGTAWAWSRAELSDTLDFLIVDEAGQISLANTLAVARAAKNLVLFGDPAQLDQPQKGVHPPGADASALEHLLGSALTLPPERGVFLPETRRLHPEVCRFTSEAFYDSRLLPIAGLEKQRIDGPGVFSGSGLRFIAVEHSGNTNRADEEVAVIVEQVEALLRSNAQWTDQAGTKKPLGPEGVLVIAPYNAQVAELKRRLPPAVRAGTVDKFQGKEAPIVIYSMTSSTGEDAPRGLEFLFSKNRLNVATSRARALVVLVASPKLLQVRCRTPRQMQLMNALCRYFELAS
jgi:superfamily I DNA and/or RNA helicase